MTLPLHAHGQDSQVQHTHRVLIADDDRLLADTLQLLLSRAGFDAIAVYDGEPAVDMARQWQPDLLLCNLLMPFMNGLQAAIRITSFLPECHVILTSGEEIAEGLMREARKHGYHFELLQKPIEPGELLAHLRLRLRTTRAKSLQCS